MTWPPRSPALNPIEMVWDELDHRVKEKQPTNAQQLKEILAHARALTVYLLEVLQ